ncbi:efflux RND transporter periplasmic adaptor subunit [Desulfococcaceae bacterium HSG8]|nr:efflux RND transporter periplasmic adaptor subunit [Desulfococcaceae bacterium HSG8]
MRTFFKLLVIILILASGVFIAKMLIKTKPPAERKPISVGSPLVETITATRDHEQVKIEAMGTVIPAREVTLQPRVSGYVVEVSSDLIPGGRLRAGDVLLRIDDRDYKIAVDQRKGDVARNLMELKMEKGKQAIAEREWNLLGSEVATTEAGRELALRKPHLKKAIAALESSRGALRKAKLDVERTEIRSPFNAFVKEKSTDVGQSVGPGTKLATLVGTDEFWIQISVPASRISKISIPGVNADRGSDVTVFHESSPGDPKAVRHGQVVRLLGDLDPAGRMARLIISVDDPFGIQNSSDPESASLPLLIGAYVKVEIQGPMLEYVFSVPRKALREDDNILIMTDEKKLAIRKVDVVWRRKDDVLVRGPEFGDQIITSRIPSPVEGMALRSSSD